MRKSLALCISMGLLWSANAVAQEQPTEQPSAQQSVDEPNVAVEEVVTALRNSASVAQELADAGNFDPDAIRIVQLYHNEEVNETITSHQSEIDALHSALEENDELWAAIQDAYMRSFGTTDNDAQLVLTQVVAIEQGSDNDLTVYIGGETSGETAQ